MDRVRQSEASRPTGAPRTSRRPGGWADPARRARLIFVSAVLFLGLAALSLIYSLRLNYPPIRSDGFGYYVYLPGFLIFRDPGLTSVGLWRFHGPFPAWTGVLPWQDSGQYLIKYTMGEAVLIMPFFGLACVVANFGDIKVDGFRWPFQYAAAFAGLFYMVAGLRLLWGALERHFNRQTILPVLLALTFGTDLFHYGTYDALFSHVFSFFLFCAFLNLVEGIYGGGSWRHCLGAGVVAGLILLTRPTNGLWLLFGVFYGVTSARALGRRLRALPHRLGALACVVLPAAAVASLQLFYWKAITGSFVIYSYGEERFSFDAPDFVGLLFSVDRGLFFWSPVLLAAVPGFLLLRRSAKTLVLPLLVFLPLNVYLQSCWGQWGHDQSGFGQRAFVDSLPAFAIGLCALYDRLRPRAVRAAFVGFGLACVLLSTWLMLKYWCGSVSFNNETWEDLMSNFWALGHGHYHLATQPG